MERKLASIQRITELVPIEGKDRIELAAIQGWHVIVEKGAYKVGDLAVYCQYDTVLPVKKEFEFLRARAYSPKYNGFRIKNMSMAGVFSEGIVFPLDILPSADTGKYPENKDVTEILGVRKYDPSELVEPPKPKSAWQKWLWKNPLYKAWKRKQNASFLYPPEIPSSSESNVQVVFGKMPKSAAYYKSEKLEGQAAVYHVDYKGKFKIYSHKIGLSPKKHAKSNWVRAAKTFDIENKMRKYMKEFNVKSMYIGGEIIGPGIQRNIYGLKDLDFHIYDAKDLGRNLRDPKLPYTLNQLKNLTKYTNLKLVPILEENVKLLSSSDEILADSEGMSALNKNVKREGIVWRRISGGKGFKAKSKSYQTWFNKKDVTI